MIHWGYPVDNHRLEHPAGIVAQLVKLSLIPKEWREKDYFDPSAVPTLPAHLTPVKVISDYLRALKDYALEYLRRTEKTITVKDVLWVVTVPGLWGEDALDVMSMAAQQAEMVQGPFNTSGQGSGHEMLQVMEAEAASLHCIKGMKERGSVDTEAAYLVVNLGGGIVELAMHSFKIIEGFTRIAALTASTGGVLGGAVIDHLFFKRVITQTVIPTWEQVSLLHPKDTRQLRNSWLKIKRYYSGLSTGQVVIDIPRKFIQHVDKKAHPDVEDEESVSISNSAIKAVFDTVLQEVLQLIHDQIEALRTGPPLNAKKRLIMFLVGGLSESSYVQSCIKGSVDESVLVFTPPSPASSSVRGAVIYGLNPSILRPV